MDLERALSPIALAAAYLLAVNVWTVLIWWRDKSNAVAGRRRAPERTLLQLAAIGGSPAAYWSRRRFRHKTLKQPFSRQLHLITAAQLCAAATYAAWRAHDAGVF